MYDGELDRHTGPGETRAQQAASRKYEADCEMGIPEALEFLASTLIDRHHFSARYDLALCVCGAALSRYEWRDHAEMCSALQSRVA